MEVIYIKSKEKLIRPMPNLKEGDLLNPFYLKIKDGKINPFHFFKVKKKEVSNGDQSLSEKHSSINDEKLNNEIAEEKGKEVIFDNTLGNLIQKNSSDEPNNAAAKEPSANNFQAPSVGYGFFDYGYNYGYNPNYRRNCIVPYTSPKSNERQVGIRSSGNGTDDSTKPLNAAEALMERYPFVNSAGALYYYEDGYYNFLTTDKAYSLLIALGYRDISKKGTIAFMKDVFEFLRVDPRIQISTDTESARYLSFNNGVLDLFNWEFIMPTPQIFTTSKVNCNFYDFAEEPATPVFDKFIFDCSGGNMQKADLLKEIIGYYITSDTAGKAFVVLWGPGDTGKSVIGKFLSLLFNSEAVCGVDLNDLSSRFDNYMLVGRKLNVAMDLPNGKINTAAVSKLKMLTGDDLCKAEGKYINPFTFRNTCKFLFASNFRVTTTVEDIGFQNRLVEVYMGNVIPKDRQDKNLIDKLISEIEGIVYKCLRYYLQYRQRNYIFTEVIDTVNILPNKSIV